MDALAAECVVPVTGEPLRPGWVGFEGGLIREVAAGRPPRELDVLDGGPGSILLPGLISAHAHLALGLERGVADDLAFLPWIDQGILPALERAARTPDAWRQGARASARELLFGGVTLVADSFLAPDGIGAAAEAGIGIRFYQEVFGSLAPDEEAYLEQLHSALDGLVALHPEALAGYAPHTPWTCPARTLCSIAARARREGRRLTIHLDESSEEHRLFTRAEGPLHQRLAQRGVLDRFVFGGTPTAYLDSLGILGPDLLAAHAVQVTPGDVALLAARGVSVVHCPASNMKLAEGIAPVAAMLEAGINVALGTDSLASADRLDMFEQMRLTLLVQRAATGRIGSLTAGTVLGMATLGGARALGCDDRYGSLERGKAADLLLVRVPDPGGGRGGDPVARVVHRGSPAAVRAVVVGGVLRHASGAA